MFSPYLKNGVMVQVAPVSEFPTAESFRKAIRALRLEFKVEPTPSVRFQSLRKRDLAFTYGQTPSVDGKPLNYAAGRYSVARFSKRMSIPSGWC